MTKGWRPIIDGALRASAINNISAIAAGIQAILARPVGNGADASLAGGRAGLAVFYTYLGKAGLAPNADGSHPARASREYPRRLKNGRSIPETGRSRKGFSLAAGGGCAPKNEPARGRGARIAVSALRRGDAR
jgi:hypothetical protein